MHLPKPTEEALPSGYIRSEPSCQSSFVNIAAGDAQHDGDRIRLIGRQPKSIDAQEQTDGQEGRPFIPIHESMVPWQFRTRTPQRARASVLALF